MRAKADNGADNTHYGNEGALAEPLIATFIDNQPNFETRKAYSRDLEDFSDWLSGQDVTEAGVADLIAFRNDLSARFAPATVARKLSALRSFYSWAVCTEAVPRSPAQHVKHPRVSSESPDGALTEAEVRRLFDAIDPDTEVGCRDRAMVALMVVCGLREGEVQRLRWVDLVTREGSDGPVELLTVRGKGAKTRFVRLPEQVIRAIEAHAEGQHLDADCPIFTSVRDQTGRPLSTRTIRKRVAQYAAKAGLGHSVSPHTLRHTAITSWVRNGANLDQARRAAGHACVKTTQRYLHELDAAENPAVGLVPGYL